MRTFHEWLNENYPNASEVNHDFLNAVGEARQKISEMHRVLERNRNPQDQKALIAYMKNTRAYLGQMLMPFDRKPVLGGVEFRIANEGSLQLFVVDNRIGQDMLEKMIMDGRIDELVQKAEGAERSLANWFRSSSAQHRENPSMIGS